MLTMWLRTLLVIALIGLTYAADDDAKNTMLSSCCSRGMYASALYQECAFDSSAPENSGLSVEDSLACGRMFADCCRAYRDTRSCASGVALALNGSFCPFVAWSSAGARERVQRSCCESCLEGIRDREIGSSALGERACGRTRTNFQGEIEYQSYDDCCRRRLVGSAAANELNEREIEDWAASEVIVHRRKAVGIQPQSSRQVIASSTMTSCSQSNPCAHHCVDDFAHVPKHCACRTGYFLAEDGATCIRFSQRESHAALRCLERSQVDKSHSSVTHTSEAHFRSEITSEHCRNGYAYSHAHHKCLDIDECSEGNRCYSDQTCVNLEGSYFCRDKNYATPSPLVHSRASLTSEPVRPTYECDAGLTYSTERGYCVDANECEENTHNCRSNEICRNTYKSFTCDCGRGYQKDATRNCVDIDECSSSRYPPCNQHEAICFNEPGSYRCLCKAGFVQAKRADGAPDLQHCVDEDECTARPDICGHYGTCTNTYGGYRCRCQDGYSHNTTTGACSDIDECDLGGRLCIGQCVNTPGGFKCTCPRGFRLDATGRVCEDIDECTSRSSNCHSTETCLNMVGEHRCYQVDCPAGYFKDPNRPNRCNKRLIKQTYDQQARRITFDSDRQPNYITYNHLTFACNVTSGRPFYEFNFDQSSDNYQFQIELADVKTRPQRYGAPPATPATRDQFRLERVGRNGAALYLTRPLTGPQDVVLNFNVLDGDGNLFYKGVINMYVSEYNGVNF